MNTQEIQGIYLGIVVGHWRFERFVLSTGLIPKRRRLYSQSYPLFKQQKTSLNVVTVGLKIFREPWFSKQTEMA